MNGKQIACLMDALPNYNVMRDADGIVRIRNDKNPVCATITTRNSIMYGMPDSARYFKYEDFNILHTAIDHALKG